MSIYLTYLETRIIVLHFAADSIWFYLHSIFWWLRKTFFTLQKWRFRRSRSSKVIEFGTNRKCVCGFLLVRHNNIGPILHRFRHRPIAGFVLMTPTIFQPIFGGVPVASARPCWSQLISRESGGSVEKNIWGEGSGPSSFGRQPRLSEITIEPISGILLKI